MGLLCPLRASPERSSALAQAKASQGSVPAGRSLAIWAPSEAHFPRGAIPWNQGRLLCHLQPVPQASGRVPSSQAKRHHMCSSCPRDFPVMSLTPRLSLL